MKGKIFSRFIVLALVLALGFNAPISVVEAKKGIKHASVCKCPYCSLELSKKAGKTLYEGQTASKNAVKKAANVTYKGKSSFTWTLTQNGKTIKYAKKGFKITVKKGTSTQKSIFLPVTRIKKLYIMQTKLTGVTEGTAFPSNKFKKKSIVKAVYEDGTKKTISTYSLVLPTNKKVTANSKQEFVVTVKSGKHRANISIPVIPKQTTSEPSALPTASPTAEPSASPTASPTAEPSASPTASPTLKPSVEPSVSPTATPVLPPIIVVVPTERPTASPTAEPSASPSASPSTTPSASPSASPSMTPSASPSASPETKFFTLNIPNAEISDCNGEVKGNTVSSGSYVSIRPKTLVNFSHWQDENGNVISKQTIHSFYMFTEMTLIPVYSNTPDTKKEVILSFPGYELLPTELKVALTMHLELPEGFTLDEWGYLYTNQMDYTENDMVYGGNVYKKVCNPEQITNIAEEISATGQATWRSKLGFSSNAWNTKMSFLFRSYVKVIAEDGKEEFVYSPIKNVSLAIPAE